MGWWSLIDWSALALAASCCAYTLVRRPPAPLWPSLPVALGLYCVWMIGDLGTTRDLENPHVWLTLLHGGGVLEPAAAWIVGLRFAEAYGRPFSWAKSRWVYTPFAISGGLALAVLTNPWHGAYLEPVPGTRSDYGPIAAVGGLYGHGLGLVMVGLYAMLWRRHRAWIVRRKAVVMMAAYGASGVFNLAYILPASPPPFDPSVLAILWSTALVMAAVYRPGLFNPLPVALPEVISSDPSGVVLLDPEGYPFFANATAKRLLPDRAWTPDAPFWGHLAESLERGRGGPSRITPEELVRELGAEEAARDGALYRWVRGPTRWLRIRRSPILTARGLEVGSAVRLHDVTALMQAQASVRSGQARFRALADHARDFVAEIDSSGRYTYINPRHAEVFGYSTSEIFEMGGRKLIHPDDLPRAAELFGKLFETGDLADATYRCRLRSGEMRWMEVTGNAFATPSGEWRAVLIARDVTERHRAAEQRAEAERRSLEARRLQSLGGLAGGVARDLNDLLKPILGNTSFLLEEISQGPEAEATLTEIEDAAAKAADLVAQLTAYAGETPLTRTRIDLSALVSDLRPELSRLRTRGAALDLSLADGLPAVDGDPVLLREAILSLAQNGFEALPETGGTVRIATSVARLSADDFARGEVVGQLREGAYLGLCVSDSGLGMSDEVRAHAFDPFFTTKGDGRGLGLAMALGIVRAHGGALRVRSEAGQGASFELLLPRAS